MCLCFYRQKSSKKRSKFSFCKLNQLVVSFNNAASELFTSIAINKAFLEHFDKDLGESWEIISSMSPFFIVFLKESSKAGQKYIANDQNWLKINLTKYKVVL